MARQPIELEVDISDLRGSIDKLKVAMKPAQFENAMYGIFQRTGGHVRKVLRQDLPRAYHVKAKDINDAVKSPKMGVFGAGAIGCNIPVRDARGSIGGRYSATGSARGWESLKKKYRVKSKIVKAMRTTLPTNMNHIGGQPPFRNSAAPKLNNVAFTRKGKKRLPIQKVVGIAIPQMPMNRSQDDVQKDIHDYLAAQIEQRFMALMRIGK